MTAHDDAAAAGYRTRRHWLAFAALLALLALTVALSRIGLGAAGPGVALAVAVAKALVVAIVFMELGRRGAVTRLFALGGLVWLAILVTLTFADYTARVGARGGRAGGESLAWPEAADLPPGVPVPQPEGARSEGPRPERPAPPPSGSGR